MNDGRRYDPACPCCLNANMLITSMKQELDDYRTILCLQPRSLEERIADLNCRPIEIKLEGFGLRPKYAIKTLQTMPPEILDRIIDFVHPKDIIQLSRSAQYFHRSLGAIVEASIEVCKAFGINRVDCVWPNFQYPESYDNREYPLSKPISFKHAAQVYHLTKCMNKCGGAVILTVNSADFIKSCGNLLPNQLILDLYICRNEEEMPACYYPHKVLSALPSSIHLLKLNLAITDLYEEKSTLEVLKNIRLQNLFLFMHKNSQHVYLLENLDTINGLQRLHLEIDDDFKFHHSFPLKSILQKCKYLTEIQFPSTGSKLGDKAWMIEVFANLKYATRNFKKIKFCSILKHKFWNNLKENMPANWTFIGDKKNYSAWKCIE
ncbi:hypothetical protein HK100_011262 [Physocladia obscura]|uniref:F-box domain-containing protein n=1 Tax=Physocladia obscura TaxID=109957 RepID=A0AAD5T7F7_9FUNG|nr:hypothetical protein HK100_011262 [Physocladia obscura]